MSRQQLRVSAFRGGTIVDDRFAPTKGRITVGKSSGNTIWLAGAHVPERHTLVSVDRKRPVLHIADGMQGELALHGEHQQPLAAMARLGQKEAGGWQLELPDSTRGWVRLGDTTFFLQEAGRPRPPPKSKLPANIRTGWLSGMDRTLSKVLASVFVVEFACVLFIATRPHIEPEAPLPEEEPERIVQLAPPVKAPPKIAEADAPKAVDKAKPSPKKSGGEVSSATDHAKTVSEAVKNSRLIAALGSLSDSGAMGTVFSNVGLSTDVAKAFDGIHGPKLASVNESPGHMESTGPHGPVGIGGIDQGAGEGGKNIHLVDKALATPLITYDPDDMEVAGSPVDKEKVGKFIHERLHSIQHCYEQELKLRPSLKGKIALSFTITTGGSTGTTSIDSDSMQDDAVANCIMLLVRSWKYPFRPADEVPVTFPFMFQPGA